MTGPQITSSRSARAGDALAHAVAAALLAAAWVCSGSAVAGATELYQARTIVTGQGEANRSIGFAACLEDVLIKVSGAQRLAADPRLLTYKAKADSFVRAFSYRDQMSGRPHRDEQGTRDRPYDLTVDFEQKKIDDVLKALGLKPWTARRPRLAVVVEMKTGASSFFVTADGKRSDLQRDALLAAADLRGMSVVLPGEAMLVRLDPGSGGLKSTSPSAFKPVAAAAGGEVVLLGQLVWDERKLGWASQWWIDWNGRTYRWQARARTFDAAFRQAVGGAAQVLSGSGNPPGGADRRE